MNAGLLELEPERIKPCKAISSSFILSSRRVSSTSCFGKSDKSDTGSIHPCVILGWEFIYLIEELMSLFCKIV